MKHPHPKAVPADVKALAHRLTVVTRDRGYARYAEYQHPKNDLRFIVYSPSDDGAEVAGWSIIRPDDPPYLIDAGLLSVADAALCVDRADWVVWRRHAAQHLTNATALIGASA